ncbi:hypothetical protein [Streptomyces sp. NPDC047070]|uniref:hypothetical protein n=1 Tax=Streptomyces sp. NPDC047070 TaxID=3154923 RepID=UPI003451A6FF
MTGGGAAAPPAVTVETGEAREAWCKACKAWTRATGDVLVLTADGVTTVGTWSLCEIDPGHDPDDLPRGPGRV